MAIFRVNKTKDYTVMSNFHLRDMNLSLKAKGLLSVMLSLPEYWDYTLKGLAFINKEKIDAVRTAVLELEEAGYITRKQGRDEKGKMAAIEYTIYEMPQSSLENPISEQPESEEPRLENPISDNPNTDNSTSENPTQINIDKQNTEELNTKKQNKEKEIYYCAEQKNCSAPEAEKQAVISLELNDKTFYKVTREQIEHWSELYLAVNILQQLKIMQGWIESNPKK